MARRRRRPSLKRRRERPGDKYFREYERGLRSTQKDVPGPPAPRPIPTVLPGRSPRRYVPAKPLPMEFPEKPLAKSLPPVVPSALEPGPKLPKLPMREVIPGVKEKVLMPDLDQGPKPVLAPCSHSVPPQRKTPPAQAERGLPYVETDAQEEVSPARVGPVCPLLGEACLGPDCQWFDGISKCSVLSINESLSHLISLMNSLHAFLEYWKKDQ